MLWFSPKTFEYPISRAVVYSLVGHLCAAFLLFVLGILPLPTRKLPRPRIQPMQVQIEMPTEPVKKPDKTKGEKREIDVDNAVKPVADPPKPPKPTPIPPPLTPNPDTIYEPLPTPKSLVKTAENKKKVLPTPEPTAKPTAKPTPAPTAKPKTVKQDPKKVVSTPVPTPKPTPRQGPVQKGDPDGQTKQPAGVMQTEEGVTLPASYILDAQRRFRDKFNIPLHIVRQLERQGVQVVCVVSFKIARDGRIFDVEVVQSTGRDQLDLYAKRTLTDVAKLLPLVEYTKKPHIKATVPFQFGR